MGESKRPQANSVTRAQEEWIAARDRQTAEAVEERARAEELWQRLQASGDRKAWKDLVLDDPGYASWAFCERLCDESAELAEDDTGAAFELVGLALELAPKLSCDEKLLCGIQEYIWKHLGNVLRARGDLKGAGEAFERAGEFFLGGITGTLPSLIRRDRLAALEAALQRDRGDHAEASRMIDHALTLAGDDRSSRSALLLEKVRLRRRLGRPEEALQVFSWSHWLDGISDSRLAVRLEIERIGALCDLGRYGEIVKLPGSLRQTAKSFPLERTRLLCLEGRVAAGLGRAEEADAALQAVRAEGHDRAVLDLALLTLEVAALHARQGRTAELKRLAEEALPLLEAPRLDREAAATLKLWSRLAAQEKLNAERATQFARDFARVPAGR